MAGECARELSWGTSLCFCLLVVLEAPRSGLWKDRQFIFENFSVTENITLTPEVIGLFKIILILKTLLTETIGFVKQSYFVWLNAEYFICLLSLAPSCQTRCSEGCGFHCCCFSSKCGEVLVYREAEVGVIGTAVWRVCGSNTNAEYVCNKDPLLGCFSALEKKIVGHASFVFY